jgi:dephospho-CoA kinase
MRSTEPKSLCVGVTGSAGSGKTTLCRMWTGRGADYLDADAVGRELLRSGSPVFPALVEAFGAQVVGPDGDIDRARLGARVFGDRTELVRLNSLVHPPLLRELHRCLALFRAAPGPARVLILDAALLAEWGDRGLWDRLVVVTAPRALQLRRLERQRGLAPADAAARLAAQMPEAERVKLADHRVVNDGDLAQLERTAGRLWQEWQALLE